MSFELWLFYCAAAVGLSLTPGPNGLLVLSHGMRFGVARSVFTALGGVCGFFLLVAASLAGLGALLAASERAFTLAKWVGALYLVYLGIRTWNAPPPAIEVNEASPGSRRQSNQQCFREGFLVAVTNPKALIFFAAFLPQFMQVGVPYVIQLLVLGGTFAVVEFVYEVLLAAIAQRVAPWLGRNGRVFNRAAGATFVGIGVALASANRP